MHASIDFRLVLCLDALNMSFEMLDLTYSQIYGLCIQLKEKPELISSAFLQCWTFIDVLHRVREVAQSIPGLSKKQQELREFLLKTEEAEFCRHYIQHLRGELSKIPHNKFPVWGSLAWLNPNDETEIHIAFAGVKIEGIEYASLIYDTHERRFLSKVALGIGEKSFNFDPIYQYIQEFRSFIVEWIQEKYTPGIQMPKALPISSIKINYK